MVLIPWRKWKSKRLPSVSDLELCLVTAAQREFQKMITKLCGPFDTLQHIGSAFFHQKPPQVAKSLQSSKREKATVAL
ncbi:unnamed protein product [Arabidopsis lyrata]|nr:unnamed protein product [Arabidopsis lyrata]